MMENEQKEVKVISYTWWIGAIIGVIIGFANSDSRYVDSQPVAEALKWGLMWTILGAVIGFVIDQTRTSTVVKNISENIDNQKKENQLKKDAEQSMKNYQDSSHHFQFLSDATLLAKCQNNESSRLTEMDRLALEEELVKRKLLKYFCPRWCFSPTDEMQ